MMEFHVSRQARDRYQFDQALFALSGNVIFANFHAARLFAQKINQKRDLVNFPERAARAAQINAMGMIDEILHLVIALYQQQANPQAMAKALAFLDEQDGRSAVDAALRLFADEFPPLAVYRREMSLPNYLEGETDGVPNRQLLFEELLMLWLTNMNPATAPYSDLFDDTALRKETPYLKLITDLKGFYETQPHFGPENQNLIDMLRAPALANPYSLTGQLEFIRERWGTLLGKLLYRILGSLDFIKEEDRQRFGTGGGGGPQPVPVYRLGEMEGEPERFSQDKDWMPRCVVIAKNAYVWLDQLSRKYGRPITHLDHIPDEELDALGRWGFSGLWLIGLWERSSASQKIKQLCGNPDAVASAYSLARYEIAYDLGGEEAYRNLRDRAWQRGIRLASDMVPNHMGIDSNWVIDHPDWFISLDYSPFPSYTFNSPDLSPDGRVVIQIEDHYFDRTDAAVVFKRYDRGSGDTRYIYHGNDGTSMPWNDTAQLNYLKPEVREAVIQTILHVARQFPIIRFDAAMTLAKKHYQRLWYPEPGTGGDISSRAEHGLTREQFDAAIPVEFWREVVDRVAREVPDTLLLAEAFWLMEGYFVRTLGMHRVYNSAFMNMLRNEDNANYRAVFKNTLEFDPEILKRFVNFMNNPDERTAVDQFGKGDKYFGICTLMATLPGLPMFGHGQIEGFSEKYGMEFRRAYWDEKVDEDLVRRHEREIFPLLHRRHLFAEVSNFLLYDFYSGSGVVNEDVYAFSNGAGDEHALVIYHNHFGSTRGWIRTSVGFLSKSGAGDSRRVIQKTLGEGLGLHNTAAHYTLFKDSTANLEYIRSSNELWEQGLYVELDAYKYFTFLDFREVVDDEWHQYAQLCAYLNGRGVPSIDEALKELFLAPIHQPFRQLVNAGMFRYLLDSRVDGEGKALNKDAVAEFEQKSAAILAAAKRHSSGSQDPAIIAADLSRQLEAVLSLPVMAERFPLPGSKRYTQAMAFMTAPLDGEPARWGTLFGWLAVHNLGKVISLVEYEDLSRTWIDEWMLGRILASTAQDLGLTNDQAWNVVSTIKLLTTHQRWFESLGDLPAYTVLETWLKDSEIQNYLQVNRFKGILWFNREAFEDLLWWMMFLAVIQITANPETSAAQVVEQVVGCYDIVRQLLAAEKESAYQVDKLLEALK